MSDVNAQCDVAIGTRDEAYTGVLAHLSDQKGRAAFAAINNDLGFFVQHEYIGNSLRN